MLFVLILAKVLESLSRNLINKSKMYDSIALQAIFMLNNYNYIIKNLQKYVFICKFIQFCLFMENYKFLA